MVFLQPYCGDVIITFPSFFGIRKNAFYILTCKDVNWEAIYFRQLLFLLGFHVMCFCRRVACEGVWNYVDNDSIGKEDDSQSVFQWIVKGVGHNIWAWAGDQPYVLVFPRLSRVLGVLFYCQTTCQHSHPFFPKNKVTIGRRRWAKIH